MRSKYLLLFYGQEATKSLADPFLCHRDLGDGLLLSLMRFVGTRNRHLVEAFSTAWLYRQKRESKDITLVMLGK